MLLKRTDDECAKRKKRHFVTVCSPSKSARAGNLSCHVEKRERKRRFVTAGFPFRSACAGVFSCHVTQGEIVPLKLRKEMLSRRTYILPSKAPIRYGRFSFQKCSHRKFILPCSIGEQKGHFVVAGFPSRSAHSGNFCHVVSRTKVPLCYGRFSFQKQRNSDAAGVASRSAHAGSFSCHVV